jgi:integrase
MGSWRRSDVERWIVRHPDWSPRSRQKFVAVVKTFAAWCTAESIVLGGALDGIRLPKVARRRRDPLGAAQVRALLDAAAGHPWLELPIALAATTGLSLGDLRDLEWRDVDLRAGRIMRNRVKSGRPLDVRIGSLLRGVLRRHAGDAGPVCVGMPTSDSAISKAVRALYAEAGVARVKGQGLHYLRTAFVSIGLAATGDLTAVADVVGDAPDVVSRRPATGSSGCAESRSPRPRRAYPS